MLFLSFQGYRQVLAYAYTWAIQKELLNDGLSTVGELLLAFGKAAEVNHRQ